MNFLYRSLSSTSLVISIIFTTANSAGNLFATSDDTVILLEDNNESKDLEKDNGNKNGNNTECEIKKEEQKDILDNSKDIYKTPSSSSDRNLLKLAGAPTTAGIFCLGADRVIRYLKSKATSNESNDDSKKVKIYVIQHQ